MHSAHQIVKQPSNIYEIGGVSVDTFKGILKYIYSENIEINSPNQALETMQACSTFFEMPEISSECEKYLINSITKENVLEYL